VQLWDAYQIQTEKVPSNALRPDKQAQGRVKNTAKWLKRKSMKYSFHNASVQNLSNDLTEFLVTSLCTAHYSNGTSMKTSLTNFVHSIFCFCKITVNHKSNAYM
jgi:hypothetical protein